MAGAARGWYGTVLHCPLEIQTGRDAAPRFPLPFAWRQRVWTWMRTWMRDMDVEVEVDGVVRTPLAAGLILISMRRVDLHTSVWYKSWGKNSLRRIEWWLGRVCVLRYTVRRRDGARGPGWERLVRQVDDGPRQRRWDSNEGWGGGREGRGGVGFVRMQTFLRPTPLVAC